MEAKRLLGLSLLTIGLCLDSAAATIASSLYIPQLPIGDSSVDVDLTGITPPSQTPFAGPGYSVSFSTTTPIQGVVQGNLFELITFLHAVPVAGVIGVNTPQYLTGGFGSPLTTSVADSGNYFSTGFFGTITITFATPQTSFALLWGSIDTGNFLTFNDSASTVVTGTQIQAATPGFISDGFQGPGGSAWVRITTDTPFTSVTADSNVVSFEFAAVRAAAIPEPSTLLLSGSVFGIGLLVWLRRSKFTFSFALRK